jgi:hypothetical protein
MRTSNLLSRSKARLIERLLIPAAFGLIAICLTSCGVQGSGATAATPATQCASQDLGVSSEPLEGAGPSFLVFTLKNTGPTSCTISGVPYLTITDAAGNALSKPNQSPATSPSTGAVLSPSPVDVAPGSLASYWVEFIPCDAPANDNSIAARLTAAGVASGAPLSVPFQATPGCQTLIVSPVVSGVVDPPGFTTGGAPPAPIPPAAESEVQAKKAANPSSANIAGARSSARARTCAGRSRQAHNGRHGASSMTCRAAANSH